MSPALDFSSDFGSAPIALDKPVQLDFAPSAPIQNGSTPTQPAALVIGSQQAAQSGAYQQAVQAAGQDGQTVEMHMVDRLTDAGTTLASSAYININALVPLSQVTPDLLSLLLSALAPNGSLEVAPTDLTDADSLRHAKGELTVAGFVNSEVMDKEGSKVVRGIKSSRAGAAPHSVTSSVASAPTTTALPLRRKLAGSGNSKKALWAVAPASSVGLIDSDSLLTEADRLVPSATRRADCPPGEDGGPRRKKACKNCTCGLRELEEAEATGDVIRIDDMDMDMPAGTEAPKDEGRTETVETTVMPDGTTRVVRKIQVDTKGATSSCGSCFLGDAFRCSSCPFLGMPAFEPGQKVEIPASMDDSL